MKRIFILSLAFSAIMCGGLVVLPAQSATLIEEFENNRNGWHVQNNEQAQVGLHSGVYRLFNKQGTGYIVWSRGMQLPVNSAFGIAAKMRLIQADPRAGFGLAWGIADAFTHYRFVVNGKGLFKISRWDNKRETVILNWTPCGAAFVTNGYNVLSVVGAKNTATGANQTFFFLNNNPLATTSELPRAGTGIGFVCEWAMVLEADRLEVSDLGPYKAAASGAGGQTTVMEGFNDGLTQERKYLLGVDIQDASAPLKAHLKKLGFDSGVYIAGVQPGTIAEKEGLRKGDVMISIEKKKMFNPSDAVRYINGSDGDIEITLLRNDAILTKHIRLMVALSSLDKGTALGASAVIHGVKVIPQKVAPGQDFALEVNYTVCDYESRAQRLGITISYMILKDKQVLFSKKAGLEAENGKETFSVKKGLIASREPGTYEVRVVIEYKNKMAGESAQLAIK